MIIESSPANLDPRVGTDAMLIERALHGFRFMGSAVRAQRVDQGPLVFGQRIPFRGAAQQADRLPGIVRRELDSSA